MCKLTLEILQQRIFGRHYDTHDLAHLHSSNSAVVEKEREPAFAFSQWLNYPATGVPRTRDGKVNLSARAPPRPGR
jgi:hypothetical protein